MKDSDLTIFHPLSFNSTPSIHRQPYLRYIAILTPRFMNSYLSFGPNCLAPPFTPPPASQPLLPIILIQSPVFTYSCFIKFEYLINVHSLEVKIGWIRKLKKSIKVYQIYFGTISDTFILSNISDVWTKRTKFTIRTRLTVSKWNLI